MDQSQVILEKLSQVTVMGAEYDSPERRPHPSCLKDTRVNLLDDIYDLLGDQKKSQLIWLNGTAGVGKSAVAFTVAARMREDTMRLAGTFFFSRKYANRCTTGYFFATLAYQLAINFPHTQDQLTTAIRENPALLNPRMPLRKQMDALFLLPLLRLRFRRDGHPPLVFVVDALDECTSKEEIPELISLLGEALRYPGLPMTKILLTGRSEAHIREAIRKEEMHPQVYKIPADISCATSVISLDDADVDSDICIFLKHSFTKLQHRCPNFPQLAEHELVQLASRAGRRFIVASTMINFIDDEHNHDDPHDRLQLMLQLTCKQLPGMEVYKLYDLILSTCSDPKRAYQYLSAVAALANPLPVSQISGLFGPGEGKDVETALVQLRSVMDIPTSRNLPVNIYHSSVCDYVSSPSNCGLFEEEMTPSLMARKGDWDNALHDALKPISIQPSVTDYISQGIALCGKNLISDAMGMFDLAFMFTDRDAKTTHILLLVKAIALFNANKHQDAFSRIQQLANACPNADTLACSVVEAYLRVQLGINALDDASHNEAAYHFTTAINSNAFSSEHAIHLKYEVFVVLFGWDLKSLWQIANQKRCDALLRARRLAEAHEAYCYMMDMSDEATTVNCHDWSLAFEQECLMLYTRDGDSALFSKDYDKAIELYSAAIDLDSASDTIFASRCKAKLGKMLWEDALVDAQKVIELNSSSYTGYELKNAALHGAQRYDEAIITLNTMLSKLDDVSDTHSRELRQQYITLSKVANVIQEVIHAQLEDTPHRLINTITGRLCNRAEQIIVFKTSPEYKELLSSTNRAGADLPMEHIKNAVEIYFRAVMLSHRWEGNESLLRHIQDRDIYQLKPVGGIMKLQSFCKTARDASYRWAWIDTCCIDQTNNVEVQESVNSMFVWYRFSALTIIYLSDVPPLSKSGALANSVWIQRGWTVQEFLAPRFVHFYQSDWTLYLNDRSPNHKDSPVIMRELADATGIDPQSLVAFRPGMRGAREKLQWVSMRITTLQEDIAYSLFGIFGIHLPVIYGEKKQNALGRLLQEVIAQSGDISCLDWVGKPSDFNSCLPADITSYRAPPCALWSPLSKDAMQMSVSSLRHVVDAELTSKLYQTLYSLSAPQFTARRLRLPCIAFSVTGIRQTRGKDHQSRSTFEVKTDGLHDLLVTTNGDLIQFSPERPTRRAFLLVRPWDRSLLELQDFDDFANTAKMEGFSQPVFPLVDSPVGSLGANSLVDSEAYSRELRLIAHLGQPFSALLLAQQWGGEYKRIAPDENIFAQVKNMIAVRDMMDVRIVEIL